MTLIELFDPHDLAFPLKGQLVENFELEVLDKIPAELSGRKSNLLIIVGKTYAELEQYKVLKDYYLAIVVFIKDMETTQIRSLQHKDESFDAYFAIPWQKTALKFYLEDLAEYKAMELKDELELSDKLKGNQTKSQQLQNLFDLAPGEELPFGDATKTQNQITKSNNEISKAKPSSDNEMTQTGDKGQLMESDEGKQDVSQGIDLGDFNLDDDINFDANSDDLDNGSSQAKTDHSKTINIDSLDDLELGSDQAFDGEIGEEDAEDNLFDLEDSSGGIDFNLFEEDHLASGLAESEEESEKSSNDFEENDLDELDFSINETVHEDQTESRKDSKNGSLSLSEDAVKKLKEIDEILDNDNLSETSLSKIASQDSLELSLSDDEDLNSENLIADEDQDDDEELDFGISEEKEELDLNTVASVDRSISGEIELSTFEQDLDSEMDEVDDDNIELGSAEDDSELNVKVDEEASDPFEEDDEEFEEFTGFTTVIGEDSVKNIANELHEHKQSLETSEDKLPARQAPLKKLDHYPVFDGDLERAGAIIAELRSEREYLEKRVNELEKEKLVKESSTLDMRSELGEKKIELQILKKRHQSDLDQLRIKLNESEERRIVSEEKRRVLEQEFDRVKGQVNFDIKKIKSRERELEDRIDLIKKDAEIQIRNRDSSIIDLKRKIDMLEFNLDNAVEKDKKNIETKYELENKVDKVMQTLRNAIGVLEEDIRDTNIKKLDGESNG